MRPLALSIAFAVAALLANAATATQRAVNPCQLDAEKLCHETAVGGGERLACLFQHESELSSECKTYLKQRQAHRANRQKTDNPNRAWFSLCSEDLKKFCSDIPAGRGVLGRCLQQHESALSPNCKAAFDARQKAAAR